MLYSWPRRRPAVLLALHIAAGSSSTSRSASSNSLWHQLLPSGGGNTPTRSSAPGALPSPPHPTGGVTDYYAAAWGVVGTHVSTSTADNTEALDNITAAMRAFGLAGRIILPPGYVNTRGWK